MYSLNRYFGVSQYHAQLVNLVVSLFDNFLQIEIMSHFAPVLADHLF